MVITTSTFSASACLISSYTTGRTTASGLGPRRGRAPQPDQSGAGKSPAARHVRLDGLPGPVKIGTGRLHVQPHGMQLVAGRPGQTVSSCLAWIGINLNAQQLLRDHPGVTRTVGHVENFLGRIIRDRKRTRSIRIIRACDHDMRCGFNLKKRHLTDPFRLKKPGTVRIGWRPQPTLSLFLLRGWYSAG